MAKEDKQEKKLAKKEAKTEKKRLKKEKKAEWKRKHPVLRWLPLALVVVLIVWAYGFFYFGGYKFEAANVEEFGKYAQSVESLEIPGSMEIVALGEATHGNAEFQQIKLDVFKQLVEKNGVRAMALEADYASCLVANEYIHGGKGTALDAAKALGFRIYETQQMVNLMDYMRKFNETVKAGEDITLYGIDMQSMEGDCPEGLSEAETQHYEECVQQRDEIAQLYRENKMWGEGGYNEVRDTYMAENVTWVLEREKSAGRNTIFLTAHNGHVAKYENTADMGSRLAQKYGDKYYTIGTAFYKTKCTLRSGSSDHYCAHTFFSHDRLAGAAKECSADICLLDFSKVPKDSELRKDIDDYGKMGELGERFSILNRILPRTYQMFRCPGKLYNSVIYVCEATPTKLID